MSAVLSQRNFARSKPRDEECSRLAPRLTDAEEKCRSICKLHRSWRRGGAGARTKACHNTSCQYSTHGKSSKDINYSQKARQPFVLRKERLQTSIQVAELRCQLLAATWAITLSVEQTPLQSLLKFYAPYLIHSTINSKIK